MRLITTLLGLAALAISAQTLATPSVYDGSFVTAATGEVRATFEGHSAAYSNDLYYSTDDTNWNFVFNNHATPWGSSVSLGNFASGTQFFFKIFVNNTGNTFYSGAASRNASASFTLPQKTAPMAQLTLALKICMAVAIAITTMFAIHSPAFKPFRNRKLMPCSAWA